MCVYIYIYIYIYMYTHMYIATGLEPLGGAEWAAPRELRLPAGDEHA